MRNLYQGDCLEVMKEIPDKSIDMVMTDPPYGTTNCKWDTVIDLDLMWTQLKRIIKPKGAIVLFGSEPFSSHLRISNIKQYKYDWIWQKSQLTGHLNAWKRPMKETEDILVFSQGATKYYPLLSDRDPKNIRPRSTRMKEQSSCYGPQQAEYQPKCPRDKNMPRTIVKFNNVQGNVHPTQKPVALMEYLIRTYTNKFETVLDFTMGSGTTGVAARNLARYFIGIELDAGYYEIAKDRIENG
jgi:DNA modification methylase